jgi:hypothetical protein
MVRVVLGALRLNPPLRFEWSKSLTCADAFQEISLGVSELGGAGLAERFDGAPLQQVPPNGGSDHRCVLIDAPENLRVVG